MSQSSFGPSSNNNALSRGLKQQQQLHINQQNSCLQSIDMLSYNNGNNNSGNSNMTVVTETGANTFTITSNTTLDQTTSISNNHNTNTGAVPKEKSGKTTKQQQQPRKPPPTIDTFWPTILQEVQSTVIDSKHQSLPLARIKKIMKLDENAKMIAAEAPTLFAKACEFFIQELTMRAWIHTDESKRRTLQRSDIAQAIANYDQFDFLIDIVPREDIKPPNHRRHHNDSSSSASNATQSSSPAKNNTTMTNVSNVVTGEILNVTGLPVDTITAAAVATAQPATATAITGTLSHTQPSHLLTTSHTTPQIQIIQQAAHHQPQQHLQYFITLPGQQAGQAQLVHQLQLQQQQQQHINNGITAGTPLTAASLNLVAQQPQQLILTATNPAGAQATNVVHQQQTALLQNLAQQQQQQQTQQQHHPQPQVQLLQQVMVTPNGEITNIPIAINTNQLNLLRLQMQQQQQQQHQQHPQPQQQQQVIIPTQLLTAQQLLHLQAVQNHHAQNNTTATTAHIVHQQPHSQSHTHQQTQQQQQQHPQNTTNAINNIYINSNTAATNPTSAASAASSMVSTDRNLGSTFRTNC